jgi:putative nucleotidyltransferase with HDIG domain
LTPSGVLIVDDEQAVRDVIKRWLEVGGHTVTTAASAEEAIERLEAAPLAVALCDIRMPGRDGRWLAEQIRQRFPETAVIMATGLPDADGSPRGPDDGVVDYLTKPFGRDRLCHAVLRGLEWHHAARDAGEWRQTLEQEMHLRQVRLSAALTAVTVENDEALDALLSMLMLKEPDALSHAYRVAELSSSVAARLGVPAGERAIIRRAALLHDIGKLAVPEAIIRKPAPLTAEERALVRRHPEIGSELVAQLPYTRQAAPIILNLHERVDGRGYPRGVPSMRAPFGARIIAVADAYDVMTHPRVFRDILTPADASDELERSSGTQFDPAVVAALQPAAPSRA